MPNEKLKHNSAKLAEKYFKDVSCEDLNQEINHITMVYNANIATKQPGPFELLNVLGSIYANQPQCQLENDPYKTSHKIIIRKELQ